jgi:hypothetical protein
VGLKPPSGGDEAGANSGASFAVIEHTHRQGHKSMRGCGVTFLLWAIGAAFLFIVKGGSYDKGLLLSIITSACYGMLFFIGPALGVLYGMEVVAYLNWRKKKGMSGMAWRLFMGFWLLVFAALFLLFGLLSIIGGVDELFRSGFGMKALLEAFGVVVLGTVLAGVGWLLGKLAFKKSSSSTEVKDTAAAQALKLAWERLDFASMEKQLGHHLPVAYKAMMQPGSEWREQEWTLYPNGKDDDDDDEMHSLIELVPPYDEALRKHPTSGETMLCFATGDMSELWLRPGSEDPAVFEWYTDGRLVTVDEIAPRFSVFLGWPKEPY